MLCAFERSTPGSAREVRSVRALPDPLDSPLAGDGLAALGATPLQPPERPWGNPAAEPPVPAPVGQPVVAQPPPLRRQESAAEMRDALLAIRERQRQAPNVSSPQRRPEAGPPAAAGEPRPRESLGQRVVHLPGFSTQQRAGGTPPATADGVEAGEAGPAQGRPEQGLILENVKSHERAGIAAPLPVGETLEPQAQGAPPAEASAGLTHEDAARAAAAGEPLAPRAAAGAPAAAEPAPAAAASEPPLASSAPLDLPPSGPGPAEGRAAQEGSGERTRPVEGTPSGLAEGESKTVAALMEERDGSAAIPSGASVPVAAGERPTHPPAEPGSPVSLVGAGLDPPGSNAETLPTVVAAPDTPDRALSASEEQRQEAELGGGPDALHDQVADDEPSSETLVRPPRDEAPGPTGAEAPIVLREGTRRFLRAAVGVDAADTPLLRDRSAGRAVPSVMADALAVDGAVVLAEQRDETTPAGLGLLAHELAHVARARAPRFVPPLLADTPPADDERLARAVEARVIDSANARAGAAAEALETPGGAVSAAGPVAAPPAASGPGRSPWGGLPAPWEPWPASAPADRTPPIERVPAPAQPPPAPTQAASSPAQPVQLAERGRSLPPQAEPAAPPAAPQERAAEPDLDALARQVYGLLRQRLAAERRRSER